MPVSSSARLSLTVPQSWRTWLVRRIAHGLRVTVEPDANPPAVTDCIPSTPVTGWPAPPSVRANDPQIEFLKQRYGAQLQVATEEHKGALLTTPAERAKAEWSNDFAVRQEIAKAYLEVAKGSVTRAQAAAQFVQTAASAVGAIYTGVLGLTFKADAATLRLDPRGLAAAVFLGLAIALATSYLAFLTRGDRTDPPTTSGDWEIGQVNRLNAFIVWTAESVYRRAFLLWASVVSLGIGVALLPIPFIQAGWLTGRVVLAICSAGLLLVVLLPAVVEWRDRRR